MPELTLADLCILIPLLEQELDSIHKQIDSDDDQVSNDASELSIPYGLTSVKLEQLYTSMWEEGGNYPPYDELIKRK